MLVRHSSRLAVTEQSQACLDMNISRIQVSRPLISIEGIIRLIAARFVLMLD